MRGVDVEGVADVGEDDVERDGRVLQHRAQLLTPSHRESHPPARRPPARLALLTLQTREPREAAVALRSPGARLAGRPGFAAAAIGATSTLLARWT